jgi:cytochrome c biogenesis protein
MRTAIVLLMALAAGAAVGSLIPQRPVNELAVLRWKTSHPGYAGLAEHLGLFDVFGSAWFTAIYALLLVSLVGCLLPRYRAFWRAVRARPKAGATPPAGGAYHEGLVRLDPEEALAGADRVLRRRRFRTVRDDGTLAAEKGHWREGGSLIFHTAFLVLLVGIAVGKGFGFSGQVAIVEGDRFTDTHVAYDSIREGRFFNERHRGFSLEVRDFEVTYNDSGIPKDFVSLVTLDDEAAGIHRDTDVRVNNPLVHRGVSIFQLAWGWAPRVRVTQNGKLLAEAPVIFLPEGGSWRGVVKVPSAKPAQLGLEMYFFNDLAITDEDVPYNRSPFPRRPVIFFQEFRGDLGLDVPQSVYALDKTRLSSGDVGAVQAGGSARLGDGIEISLLELKQYTVFQIASDPGQQVVLAAAVLILVGLIPSLYSSRRRVWVRAAHLGDAAQVQVAGVALQRKAAFEEEFRALVRELGADLHAKAEGR